MDRHGWCIALLVLMGIYNSCDAEIRRPFSVFSCKSDRGTPELNYSQTFQELCNNGLELIFNETDYGSIGGFMKFYLTDLREENRIPLTGISAGSLNVTDSIRNDFVVPGGTPLRAGIGKLCVQEDAFFGYLSCVTVRVDFNYTMNGADFGLDIIEEMEPYDVNLYQDGGSLASQIRNHIGQFEIFVANNASVPLLNTTFDTPHTVAFYLRRRHENRYWEWNYDCHTDVPDLTIRDAVLGTFTFTEALGVGERLQIPEEHLNEFNVTAEGEPMICGDAELIVHFDPFHMIRDSNRCNDFQKLEVHVHCYRQAMPRCEATMEPDSFGFESFITYFEESEVKAYRYSSWMGHEWSKIDMYNDYMTLQGMGRTKLGMKMLGRFAEEPMICEQILGRFDDDMHENDFNSMRYNASTTPVFDDLESYLDQFETNVSSNIIYSIQSMENSINDNIARNALLGAVNGMWRSYHSLHDTSDWFIDDTARMIDEFVTTAVRTMISVAEHNDHWSMRYDAQHLAEQIGNLRSTVHPALNGRFLSGIKKVFPAIIDFAQLLTEHAEKLSNGYNGYMMSTSPRPANNDDTSQCIRDNPVWKSGERALISLYKLSYFIKHDTQQFNPPVTEMCKSKVLSWYVWTTNHRSASKDMMQYLHSMDNWVEYDNDPCTKRMYAEKPQRVNVFWKVDAAGIWKGIFDEESQSSYWRLVGFCTCSKCQYYDNYDSYPHDYSYNSYDSMMK